MTLLVPALIGGGALALALIGRKKTQKLSNAAVGPAPDPAPQFVRIAPANSGNGVGDPVAPASRMKSGGSTTLATPSNPPIMRSAPVAPKQLSPVPTLKAPMLGVNATSNRVLMYKVGR